MAIPRLFVTLVSVALSIITEKYGDCCAWCSISCSNNSPIAATIFVQIGYLDSFLLKDEEGYHCLVKCRNLGGLKS